MILDIQGIDTFYGETQALFDVSLAVGAGEVVSLLGSNGAGKTTTIRSILGLTPANRGRIQFDGKDITAQPTKINRTPHGNHVSGTPAYAAFQTFLNSTKNMPAITRRPTKPVSASSHRGTLCIC